MEKIAKVIMASYYGRIDGNNDRMIVRISVTLIIVLMNCIVG